MKIRYIIPALTVLICCSAFNAESSVFLDITGIYFNAGNERNIAGLGLTINSAAPLEKYLKNTKLYLSLDVAGKDENRGEPTEEAVNFIPLVTGIRYTYPLISIPLSFDLSAGAGAVYMIRQGPKQYGAFIDPSQTETDRGAGFHSELLAGVNYRISQAAAFMFQGGYHYTRIFSGGLPSDASGWQFSLGISCTISGSGRELGSY